MIQEHILGGQKINDPDNFRDLSLQFTFDSQGNVEKTKLNNWQFGVDDKGDSADAVTIIQKHVSDGLLGGPGVGEGLPYKLRLDNQEGQKIDLFDGFVNTWSAKYKQGSVTAEAVEQGKIDWINDVIDGFTFEDLAEMGKITFRNYIPVPYCKNKKGDGLETITAIITAFIVVDKMKEQASELKKSIGRLTSPFSYGEVIAVVEHMLYLIVLVAALFKMLTDAYNSIVGPVKYHYAMYEKDLLRIGLSHLGLKMSSTILEQPPFNRSAVMPPKYNTFEENTGLFATITGFLEPNPNEQTGYPKTTFGDFFRSIKVKYNAKIVIDGDTLFFEKQSFDRPAPIKQMPPIETDELGYTHNHEDFKATRIISFAIDHQERNTVQVFKGTSVQINTRQRTVINPKMSLMTGVEDTTLAFARGIPKTHLNYPEIVLDGLFKLISPLFDVLTGVVNLVIDLINVVVDVINSIEDALKFIGINVSIDVPRIARLDPPAFKNLIEDRIGMLMLETDYTSVQKTFLIGNSSNPRNNKLLPDNLKVQNASYLWHNYHYFLSFIPQKDSLGNQWRERPFKIPFSFDDIVNVRKSNALLMDNGSKGEFKVLDVSPTGEEASGTYRERFKYAEFTETIIVPDGR